MASVSSFKRFVECGRVCLVNYGSDEGKLAVIVDIIDHNKVLVDGTTATGVRRQSMPLKRLSLTDIKLDDIDTGCKTGALYKALKAQDLEGKWAATAWAKKIAIRAKRSAANDFQRFKIAKARTARSKALKK